MTIVLRRAIPVGQVDTHLAICYSAAAGREAGDAGRKTDFAAVLAVAHFRDQPEGLVPEVFLTDERRGAYRGGESGGSVRRRQSALDSCHGTDVSGVPLR